MEISNRAKKLAAAAILVAGYLLAGHMDYEDEQDEFKRYCEMVEAGHWPDFKSLAGEC